MSFKLFSFALLLLALGAWPVASATADEYTISGVKIDLNTTNPATVRDEALALALKNAYQQLRTARAAVGEHLPESEAPWHLMQDFEIADERISATRYLGTFTIRFQPNTVAAAASASAEAVAATAASWQRQPAVFRFQHLAEWQSARTMLKNTGAVRQLILSGIMRGQVNVLLAHDVPADTLMTALLQQGFSVTNEPDNSTWLLAIPR